MRMEASAVDGRSRGGAVDKRNHSGRCLPRGMKAAAAFAVDRPVAVGVSSGWRRVKTVADGDSSKQRRATAMALSLIHI